jgi:hypothetical protein
MSSSLTANDIFVRVLRSTGVLALVLAVGGGVVGYLVAGSEGLVSALIATAVAVLFSAITVVTMIVAIRFELMAFFGIVMGAWLVKLVVFIAALFLLRDQPFIDPIVFYLVLVVSIVGTVTIDALIVMRSRVTHVDASVLPEQSDGISPKTDPAGR